MATASRFQNKTILITGGNSGMGFSTAKRIVEEGGRVIITGRDLKTLQQAEKDLGPQAEAIQADVSSVKEIETLMTKIQMKYGKIDGVFANAGIAKFARPEEFSEKDYDQVFDINVKGVFFTLQKSIPILNPGSALVVNASVAAHKGGETMAVYGATKAAVRSMARTFSSAYVAKGLRVNSISPGPIDTPIWSRPDGAIPAAHVDATKDAIAQGVPLKRYGTMDEITSAIAFLLSPESSYMVGADMIVDGGYIQL
jgi:Dehydrogenases with different specificities (related to short-chain alcohol dehydrogenases)